MLSSLRSSHAFVVTSVVVVLLQVVLALAVFRRGERVFEEEPFPNVAVVGGARAQEVYT